MSVCPWAIPMGPQVARALRGDEEYRMLLPRVVARIVYVHPTDGAETIEVSDHQIQFGYGSGGDGYCYAHQSFDCLKRLTEAECEAIGRAEEPSFGDPGDECDCSRCR